MDPRFITKSNCKSFNFLFKLSILHRNIGNKLHLLQNLRNLSYHPRGFETLGQPSSSSSATSSLLAARIPRILPFPRINSHLARAHELTLDRSVFRRDRDSCNDRILGTVSKYLPLPSHSPPRSRLSKCRTSRFRALAAHNNNVVVAVKEENPFSSILVFLRHRCTLRRSHDCFPSPCLSLVLPVISPPHRHKKIYSTGLTSNVSNIFRRDLNEEARGES